MSRYLFRLAALTGRFVDPCYFTPHIRVSPALSALTHAPTMDVPDLRLSGGFIVHERNMLSRTIPNHKEMWCPESTAPLRAFLSDSGVARRKKCLIFVAIIAWWDNYSRKNHFCSKCYYSVSDNNFIMHTDIIYKILVLFFC